MTELLAARCQNAANNAAVVQIYNDIADLSIRWNLESFGLERFELTVRTTGRGEAFDRYINQIGQRMALYSPDAYRPISGWIAEIIMLSGNRIKYVCRGAEWLGQHQYDQTVPTATETINGRIGSNLNNWLSGYVVVSDTRNLAANADTLQGWSVNEPVGKPLTQVIKELLKLSISGITPPDKSAIYDFWFYDEPFKGASLQRLVPNYAARSTSATADWIVSLKDISNLQLSRNINYPNIITSVKIYYGALTGTCTATGGGDTATTLTDSGASFLTDGIAPGDRCVNNTDQQYAIVVSVDSNTQITTTTLSGAAVWDVTDKYTVNRSNPQNIHTAGGTSITASRWLSQWIESQPDMTAAQATAYANYLINDTPKQRQSFTITAPYITHSSGVRYPLWQPIVDGGGYIQIDDLYAEAASFSNSSNDTTTFFITAMDYNNTNRSLTIHVDTKDERLDARLKAAGILRSEAVI